MTQRITMAALLTVAVAAGQACSPKGGQNGQAAGAATDTSASRSSYGGTQSPADSAAARMGDSSTMRDTSTVRSKSDTSAKTTDTSGRSGTTDSAHRRGATRHHRTGSDTTSDSTGRFKTDSNRGQPQKPNQTSRANSRANDHTGVSTSSYGATAPSNALAASATSSTGAASSTSAGTSQAAIASIGTSETSPAVPANQWASSASPAAAAGVSSTTDSTNGGSEMNPVSSSTALSVDDPCSQLNVSSNGTYRSSQGSNYSVEPKQQKANEGRVPRDLARDTAQSRAAEMQRDSARAAARAKAGGIPDSGLSVPPNGGAAGGNAGGNAGRLNPTGDTTGANRARVDSGASGNRSTSSDTLGYGRNPNQSRDSLQGNQPRKDATGQAGGVSGAAGATGAANLSSADRVFIQKAGEGGIAEVVLGCIAKQRASNPQVKQFAQRMIDDHGRANQQLMPIAEAKGVALPKDLEGEFKATAERLSRLSGPEFDRAYMSDMVKDHQKDVAEFEREATGAQDPDVKSFASQTLPIIQQHLDLARQVSSGLKAGSRGSSK